MEIASLTLSSVAYALEPLLLIAVSMNGAYSAAKLITQRSRRASSALGFQVVKRIIPEGRGVGHHFSLSVECCGDLPHNARGRSDFIKERCHVITRGQRSSGRSCPCGPQESTGLGGWLISHTLSSRHAEERFSLLAVNGATLMPVRKQKANGFSSFRAIRNE